MPTDSVDIPSPSDALQFLGHEIRQQAVGGIGYSYVGDWRDTILLPPLSNITVSDRWKKVVFCTVVSN